MPGFKVAPTHMQDKQPAAPALVVYTYTWDVTNLVGSPIIIGGAAGALIYLKEANFPGFAIEAETVKTGHTTYEFAKSIKWEDIKLAFYDTDGLGKQLEDLKKKVWNSTSGIRPADEYMAETTINGLYADDSFAYGWSLKNSWIKGINFSKLTYETSGINTANVTVAYSWAEFSNSNA